MITIKLVGGLGNQMFQYAAAKAQAIKLRTLLQLDTHSFEKYPDRNYDLHIFHKIDDSFCNKSLHKTFNSKSLKAKIKREFSKLKMYKEPHFQVDQNFFLLEKETYLSGYFQSEDYFIKSCEDIRLAFTWDTNRLTQNTRSYFDLIQSQNSVSIHFRRGDYVSNTKANEVHGLCSFDYYKQAISLIFEKHPNCHFFVFSDDIPWVKKQDLFSNMQCTYIEKPNGTHDSEEMFLMSKCKHNIIANSSFSWWGAWLNNNDTKIVIAPAQWFQVTEIDTSNLIPKSWLRL